MEHQLTGFFTISHAVLLGETVLLSLIVVAMARRLSLRHPWLAGALVLATPTLLGHSFTNTKDVPFALFYSLYTLGSILRLSSPPQGQGPFLPGRPALLSLLGATLMMNLKMVSLAPVVISEGVLALLRWRSKAPCDSPRDAWLFRLRSLLPVLVLPTVALAGALMLQPASWGVPPWRYVPEAFATFAVHTWGGCMWFDGQCVGIHDPSWSAAGYMLRWLGVKLPLLLILLPFVQAVAWLRRGWGGEASREPDRGTALPLLLQLLLIPALAVARNSNLYDADRHLLFLVPPLAVLAVMGFERLQELPDPPTTGVALGPGPSRRWRCWRSARWWMSCCCTPTNWPI